MVARILLIIAAAALLVAARDAAVAAEKGDPLGRNLAGEACPLGASGAAGAVRTLPILCAEKAGSGTLYVVPFAINRSGDLVARRAEILAAARAMPGGLGRGTELRCDAGAPVAADND